MAVRATLEVDVMNHELRYIDFNPKLDMLAPSSDLKYAEMCMYILAPDLNKNIRLNVNRNFVLKLTDEGIFVDLGIDKDDGITEGRIFGGMNVLLYVSFREISYVYYVGGKDITERYNSMDVFPIIKTKTKNYHGINNDTGYRAYSIAREVLSDYSSHNLIHCKTKFE